MTAIIGPIIPESIYECNVDQNATNYKFRMQFWRTKKFLPDNRIQQIKDIIFIQEIQGDILSRFQLSTFGSALGSRIGSKVASQDRMII